MSLAAEATNLRDADSRTCRDLIDRGHLVLVDFWAEWCGPCRMVAPVLDEIADENTNVRIVKVNVDENQQLAFEYGVQSIPTFILFKGGEVAGKMMGAGPKPTFENFIAQHAGAAGAATA